MFVLWAQTFSGKGLAPVCVCVIQTFWIERTKPSCRYSMTAKSCRLRIDIYQNSSQLSARKMTLCFFDGTERGLEVVSGVTFDRRVSFNSSMLCWGDTRVGITESVCCGKVFFLLAPFKFLVFTASCYFDGLASFGPLRVPPSLSSS